MKNDFMNIEANSNYCNRLLRLALDIGEGMLESGAEIHRVEESIEKICKAYDAIHVEVFAITSLIVASIRLENGEYSMQMRRIHTTSNYLLKIEEYNKISRYICDNTPSLNDFEAMLLDAKKKIKYPRGVFLLGGGLAAASFTIVFGGDWFDSLVAAVIGCIVVLIDFLPSKNSNLTVKSLVVSFICGFLVSLFVSLGVGHNESKIMIGTIMLLIPGLAFGNSIKDIIEGDIIAGVFRLFQSCLTAVMIAVGFGLAMLIVEAIR